MIPAILSILLFSNLDIDAYLGLYYSLIKNIYWATGFAINLFVFYIKEDACNSKQLIILFLDIVKSIFAIKQIFNKTVTLE